MGERKYLKKLLVLVLVGLLFVGYGRYVEKSVIESAELVEVTKDGYTISYNGEMHEYNYNK